MKIYLLVYDVYEGEDQIVAICSTTNKAEELKQLYPDSNIEEEELDIAYKRVIKKGIRQYNICLNRAGECVNYHTITPELPSSPRYTTISYWYRKHTVSNNKIQMLDLWWYSITASSKEQAIKIAQNEHKSIAENNALDVDHSYTHTF